MEPKTDLIDYIRQWRAQFKDEQIRAHMLGQGVPAADIDAAFAAAGASAAAAPSVAVLSPAGAPVAAAAPFEDAPPLPPAGFLLRLAAAIVDSILITVVTRILAAVAPGALGVGIGLALTLSYAIVLPVRMNGQTLGKKAVNIRIEPMERGALTYRHTLLRYLGQVVCMFTMTLGYWSIFFTEQKRGLHDFIAGTRVVRL